MKTNELREILKLYGLQHDVVINKSSRRYSIILDNNIIGTNHDKERVVVFRPIPEGKNTFCMERDRFTPYEIRRDAFESKEEALKHAEERRAHLIESIKKQLNELENLKFECDD